MGKVYQVGGENQTMSTGNAMIGLRTAASASAACVIQILRLEITQNATATGAMCRGEIATRDTAGTFTMTSATPNNMVLGGPAGGLTGNTAPAGGDGRIGITSSADSGGTYTQRRPFNFHNLNGYLYVTTPQDRIIVPPSTVLVVRFAAAPGTTTGWTFSMEYEELI